MYCIGRQLVVLLPTKMDLSSPPSLSTVWSSAPLPHLHLQNGIFFNTQDFFRLNWYVFLFSLFLFLFKNCHLFYLSVKRLRLFGFFFYIDCVSWLPGFLCFGSNCDGLSWILLKFWVLHLGSIFFFMFFGSLNNFFYVYGFWLYFKSSVLGILLGGFVCFRC